MSFVKIIFQLVRNGRYIFPIPPCLSFLNTFASALKQRRLLEQLQRAAVESSMSSAPQLCRLHPILSSSCLFALFKMAHCPLLPVPAWVLAFSLKWFQGILSGVPLLLSFFVIKRSLANMFLSLMKNNWKGIKSLSANIYSCLLLPPHGLLVVCGGAFFNVLPYQYDRKLQAYICIQRTDDYDSLRRSPSQDYLERNDLSVLCPVTSQTVFGEWLNFSLRWTGN